MEVPFEKALITGGNSGIGLATARLFIAEGAQVAITGRDQQTLDEAIAELGSSARGYRVDVTIAEDRKRLFAALAKDFGKLDIVFANAGITGRTPAGSADEAIFENVIHTNLNAAFFTVNSAVPLLNDNGNIIFCGSVHNYLGQPGVAAYAATKGGLVSLARSIAADLAPRNIRVNVVALTFSYSTACFIRHTAHNRARTYVAPVFRPAGLDLHAFRPHFHRPWLARSVWIVVQPSRRLALQRTPLPVLQRSSCTFSVRGIAHHKPNSRD